MPQAVLCSKVPVTITSTYTSTIPVDVSAYLGGSIAAVGGNIGNITAGGSVAYTSDTFNISGVGAISGGTLEISGGGYIVFACLSRGSADDITWADSSYINPTTTSGSTPEYGFYSAGGGVSLGSGGILSTYREYVGEIVTSTISDAVYSGSVLSVLDTPGDYVESSVPVIISSAGIATVTSGDTAVLSSGGDTTVSSYYMYLSGEAVVCLPVVVTYGGSDYVSGALTPFVYQVSVDNILYGSSDAVLNITDDYLLIDIPSGSAGSLFIPLALPDNAALVSGGTVSVYSSPAIVYAEQTVSSGAFVLSDYIWSAESIGYTTELSGVSSDNAYVTLCASNSVYAEYTASQVCVSNIVAERTVSTLLDSEAVVSGGTTVLTTSTWLNLISSGGVVTLSGGSVNYSNSILVSSGEYTEDSETVLAVLSSMTAVGLPFYRVYSGGSIFDVAGTSAYPRGNATVSMSTGVGGISSILVSGGNTERSADFYISATDYPLLTLSSGAFADSSSTAVWATGGCYLFNAYMTLSAPQSAQIYLASGGSLYAQGQTWEVPASALLSAAGRIYLSGGTWTGDVPGSFPHVCNSQQQATAGLYKIIPSYPTPVSVQLGGFSAELFIGYPMPSGVSGITPPTVLNASGGTMFINSGASLTNYSVETVPVYSGKGSIYNSATPADLLLSGALSDSGVLIGGRWGSFSSVQNIPEDSGALIQSGGFIDIVGNYGIVPAGQTIMEIGGDCVLYDAMVRLPVYFENTTYSETSPISSGESLSGLYIGSNYVARAISGGLLQDIVVSGGGSVIVAEAGVISNLTITSSLIPGTAYSPCYSVFSSGGSTILISSSAIFDRPLNGLLTVSTGGTALVVSCLQEDPVECYSGGVIESLVLCSGGSVALTNIASGASVTVIERGGILNTDSFIGIFGNRSLLPASGYLQVLSNNFEFDYNNYGAPADVLPVVSSPYDVSPWKYVVYIDSEGAAYRDSTADNAYLQVHTSDGLLLTVSADSAGNPDKTCSVNYTGVSTVGEYTELAIPEYSEFSLHSNTALYYAVFGYVPPTSSYDGGCFTQNVWGADVATTAISQDVLAADICGGIFYASNQILLGDGIYREICVNTYYTGLGSNCIVVPKRGKHLYSSSYSAPGIIMTPGATLVISSGACAAGVVAPGICSVVCQPGGAVSFSETHISLTSSGLPMGSLYVGNYDSQFPYTMNPSINPGQYIDVPVVRLGGGSGSSATAYNFVWAGGSFNRLETLTAVSGGETGFFGSIILAKPEDQRRMWGLYLYDYAENIISSGALVCLAKAQTGAEGLSAVCAQLSAASALIDSSYPSSPDTYRYLAEVVDNASAVVDTLSSTVEAVTETAAIDAACIASGDDNSFRALVATLRSGSAPVNYMISGYYIGVGDVSGPGVVISSGSYCYGRTGELSGYSTIDGVISSAYGVAYDLVLSGGRQFNALVDNINYAYTEEQAALSAQSELNTALSGLYNAGSAIVEAATVASRTNFAVSRLLNDIVPYIPVDFIHGSADELVLNRGAGLAFTAAYTDLPASNSAGADFTIRRLSINNPVTDQLVVPIYEESLYSAAEDIPTSYQYNPLVYIKELFVVSGGVVRFIDTDPILSGAPHAGLVDSFYVGSNAVVFYGNELSGVSGVSRTSRYAYVESGGVLDWRCSCTEDIGWAVPIISGGSIMISPTTVTLPDNSAYSALCVSGGAMLVVERGGLLQSVGVLSGGTLTVAMGGYVSNCVLVSGELNVASGGVVENLYVYSGGRVVSSHYAG